MKTDAQPEHSSAAITNGSRCLITTAGHRAWFTKPISIERARCLIQADTLDVVQLKHLGRPAMVMLVDDTGMDLPVNPLATELYLANCKPGTTHQIRGDVFICPDADFA